MTEYCDICGVTRFTKYQMKYHKFMIHEVVTFEYVDEKAKLIYKGCEHDNRKQ